MALHSSLTDPNIHEPKGASTANDGEVYVADGAGSGAWEAKLPAQTGNSGKLLTTNGTVESWSGNSSVRARASITDGSSATCTVGSGAVNIASVTYSAGTYTVTFTSALASVNYQVLISLTGTGGFTDVLHRSVSKSVGSFTFQVIRSSTGVASSYSSFDFTVYGGF